ncbi:MAG: protease TldD [Deltaproteobacteria bacterium ADurb.Bin207]|jgi:hypothetical protein|nr:MAG: protease TldD [Deltaproteobacteria bacterium ADurb.Bin207]
MRTLRHAHHGLPWARISNVPFHFRASWHRNPRKNRSVSSAGVIPNALRSRRHIGYRSRTRDSGILSHEAIGYRLGADYIRKRAKHIDGRQIDISSGDFVCSLTESFLIENGRITAPISGANIIGNGSEIFRRVKHVDFDVAASGGVWINRRAGQSTPTRVGCPTVAIVGITVSSKKR